MTIRYLQPLAAAYDRMKAALFRKFDLVNWLVVGFSSWIAGWGLGGGSSIGSRLPTGGGSSGVSVPTDVDSFVRQVCGWWADPVWRITIIVIFVLSLALALVILWVTSRGEFVFLDSVLNGRSAIAAPWHAYRAQGNSLFLWRLVFGLCVFVGFAVIVGTMFFVMAGGVLPHGLAGFPWLRFLVGLGLVWLPLIIASLYIHLFLRHFVTPIMFRDRTTTTEAWRTLRPILSERLGSFLVYGLFLLAVEIGVVIALIPAILLTCCLLGCLLALPFIGTVVWLPVSYTVRAFGPEFLAQFGPAYDVWPPPPAPPTPTAPPEPPLPPEPAPEPSA
jgi:hypothetical protein